MYRKIEKDFLTEGCFTQFITSKAFFVKFAAEVPVHFDQSDLSFSCALFETV